MDLTKELVLTYFEAWQKKQWDQLRACLSPDFAIDGGQVQFQNVDAFILFCQNGPSWSRVKLLDALYLEDKAALLYEGFTPTNQKIRVAEFISIHNNKISKSLATISLA